MEVSVNFAIQKLGSSTSCSIVIPESDMIQPVICDVSDWNNRGLAAGRYHLLSLNVSSLFLCLSRS